MLETWSETTSLFVIRAIVRERNRQQAPEAAYARPAVRSIHYIDRNVWLSLQLSRQLLEKNRRSSGWAGQRADHQNSYHY